MIRLRQKKKQQQIPILLLNINKSLAQFSVKDVSEFKPVLDKNVQKPTNQNKTQPKKPIQKPKPSTNPVFIHHVGILTITEERSYSYRKLL